MQEKFMWQAIKEAQKAYSIGEVPVGAVIVKRQAKTRRNMLKFLRFKKQVKS